ncbi:MAG: hypothetical protein QM705_14800 [Ancrocorticia sp.]
MFAGAAATAFGGLLAEDTFPQKDHFSSGASFSIFRLVLFTFFIALAMYATKQLTKRQLSHGTLYYLRFQNETNPDFHGDVVSEARSKYLDFRSVSAWCDPGIAEVRSDIEGHTGELRNKEISNEQKLPRSRPKWMQRLCSDVSEASSKQDSSPSQYHVVDVRKQLNEMSAELQRTTNDDTGDSGFDVAPNLIFPAALALGYDWMPPGEATLHEFNPEGNETKSDPSDDSKPESGKSESAEDDSPEKKDADTTQHYIKEFQWRLHKPILTGQGGETPNPHDSKKPVRHFDVRGTSPYRLCAQTEYLRCHLDLKGKPTEPPRSVWLEFRVSDQDFSGNVEQARNRSIEKSRMFSDHKDEADVQRIIHMEQSLAQPSARYHVVTCTDDPKENVSGLTVFQMAEGCAYWIARTLRDFPDATIFIAAAMPKTVSFAVGYMMNQIPVGRPPKPEEEPPFEGDPETFPWFQKDGTYHPWRRIVPMGHFLFERPELRPMWVRDDQIDPNVLIDKAKAGRP